MLNARLWGWRQIDNLNRYQRSGVMHPFTCGNDHDGDRTLVATRRGWICCHCDYTQDWAHEFMLGFTEERLAETATMWAVQPAKKEGPEGP